MDIIRYIIIISLLLLHILFASWYTACIVREKLNAYEFTPSVLIPLNVNCTNF